MKILKRILLIILSILGILVITFFVLSYNPKPDLISLDRRPVTENKIDSLCHQAVNQMSLEEKVHLMSPALKSLLKFGLEMAKNGSKYNHLSYQAGGNQRLGIPTVRFFDGPRGMVSGKATCFPVPIARAATFDRNIELLVGEAISEEIRANDGNYFGGVCINLMRHPAGGRSQEGYGEDSYLTGKMGSALVKGIQKNNVMACIKHFALNNQENARFDIDVTVDDRVLRETYLPHFKECIDSGAASVMGAYNKVLGEQACESSLLLKNILRDEWNFKGFTISDFVFALKNTAKAANAGLDIEMPCVDFYGDKLLKAVQEGTVPEENVNESAFRIARTVMKFEMAPDPLPGYPKSLIGSKEHINLALEVAEKSLVLMQNTNNVLPFSKKGVKNVLVIGKLAAVGNIGDHGSSQVRPGYFITPLQGMINQYGNEINFVYEQGDDIAKVKGMISKMDAVVFIVGYNHDDEGEYITKGAKGGDRISLELHDDESNLLKELGGLNKNSVAVLIGGSAILVDDWKNNVSGIIHAFYPGMEGGTAIAKAIFGDINPGGKLPFTVAAQENQYPSFEREAKKATYDRYHGYIKMDHDNTQASFPFGFGLSYTEFKQDSMSVMISEDRVVASVNVTNSGKVAGDQVVQLYIGFDNSGVEREHKLLKGFERVSLNPGETKRVTLSCPLSKLMYYDPSGRNWVLEKMEYQVYIGSSSRETDLIKSTFVI